MSGRTEDPVRRGYRFPAGFPVAVLHDARPIPCATLNLSRTGVLLAGDFPSPTVERLDLTLKTPNGSLEVRLTCRVIRVERDEQKNETQVALQFVDMDVAKKDSLEALLARLLESNPSRSLDTLSPNTSPIEVRKILESIPLPQRIGMAQRAELKQREFLRQDTNPAVLDSLARHSKLTLAEARALTLSPFVQSGTLDTLANDLRFQGDEELRMCLATHSRVSLATAERVTADFTPAQLKKLIARPGLNQILREKLVRKMVRGSA